MNQTINNNINRFSLYFLFFIILAKVVRYTIMFDRLVLCGRGWDYVRDINVDNNSFAFNFFSNNNYVRGSVAVNNVKAFCSSINIFGIDSYYGWEILITIIFNIILYRLVVQFYNNNPFIGKKENIFIYLNVIILNIFCFCLAKEFFQMLFWIITMIAIKNARTRWQGYFRVALALGITVLFTRKYYGLMFVYFIIVDFFVDKVFSTVDVTTRRGKIKIVFSIIFLLTIMAFMYFILSSFLMMEAEDVYDEMERVNTTDRGAAVGAVSAITPIFNRGDGVVILTLEYFIKIFRLMFPIELLLHFKPTYVITIFFQGLLFYFIVNNLIHRQHCTLENKFATDLFIAFWLMSAAFEPDFGSWLRHQSVVFPVTLYMLQNNRSFYIICR